MTNKALILLTAMLLISGCSVKEKRSSCPSFLKLSLTEHTLELAAEQPVKVVVADATGGDTLILSKNEPMVWKPVQKGKIRVESLLCNGAENGGAWGAQSDSLWACTNEFRVQEEEKEIPINLHKRFCTLWLIFDREIPTHTYSILLEGRSFEDFRYMVQAPKQVDSVRLPPQKSGSYLSLSCHDATSGQELWERDLLQDLQEAGFDWDADDLQDARVYIHLVPLSFTVIVGTWRDGGALEAII